MGRKNGGQGDPSFPPLFAAPHFPTYSPLPLPLYMPLLAPLSTPRMQ